MTEHVAPGRERMMSRHWKTVALLRVRPMTIRELAFHMNCHSKTVKRDIAAMKTGGLDVVRNANGAYSLDVETGFDCAVCGARFDTDANVARHVVWMHKEEEL